MGCPKLAYYPTTEPRKNSVLKLLTSTKSNNKKRSAYFFGFNGQEKDNEVSGDGNSYTAEFWQYDPRLGRRFNTDPKYTAEESRYAVNGNNPIIYVDPNGDFKTKFGAFLYSITHGGSIERDAGGQYYVGKKVDIEGANAGYQRRFGWSGQNKPIDYGGKNPMTPWDLGFEYFSGTGDKHRTFKDGDALTEILKKHYHIEETRNKVYQDFFNNSKLQGENPFSLKGAKGVGTYLSDFTVTLPSLGYLGNSASAFMGSYQLNYKITSIDVEKGVLNVHFIVHNTSNVNSLTHPPYIGYTDAWNKYIGKPLEDAFPKSGPLSETTQTVEWDEQIKW